MPGGRGRGGRGGGVREEAGGPHRVLDRGSHRVRTVLVLSLLMTRQSQRQSVPVACAG